MARTAEAREQLVAVGEDDLTAVELRRNFAWFSVNFAVNHGVVTTPLVVATSVLYHSAAYTGNALLNIFTVLSAFLLAAPAVNLFGLKGSVLFGMLFYCAYAGLFCLAYFVGRDERTAQMLLFSVGSACGGVAAGVLWTAQGSYFARTVDLLHRKEGGERATLTASLAGNFAMLYLGCEVLAKVTWSLLDRAKVTGWVTALAFTAVGFAAMLMQTRVYGLSSPGQPAKWTTKIKAAATLWRDPCVFLLAGINLTFGFSAGFMNGYINGTYTSPQLGTFAVPMLAAGTALLAALAAAVFGRLAAKTGKAPIVVMGSAAFFCIPFCFFALRCCADWDWWLLVLYILQGVGRAVYESTGKGVFADFFPNDAAGAFANNMLQNATAFAACFFLSDYLKGPALAGIAMVLSVLTPIGYYIAYRIRQAQEAAQGAGESSSPGAA